MPTSWERRKAFIVDQAREAERHLCAAIARRHASTESLRSVSHLAAPDAARNTAVSIALEIESGRLSDAS